MYIYLRHGPEIPIKLWILERRRCETGHLDTQVIEPVCSRFEDEDSHGCVGAQPVRQDQACCSAADDDEVEGRVLQPGCGFGVNCGHFSNCGWIEASRRRWGVSVLYISNYSRVQ